MSQDTLHTHVSTASEDKENKMASAIEMLEPPKKILKPDAIDVDVAPNSSVTVVSESRMEVEGRAVIVVKKPRVKLSPEERAAKEKEKQQRLEARAAREKEKEEIKRKKEDKAKKQQKTTANFLKFFTKKQTPEKSLKQLSNTSERLWFKPFFVQPFVTLAKRPRERLSSEDTAALEESLVQQAADKLYLDMLKHRNVKFKCRQLRGQRVINERGDVVKQSEQRTSSSATSMDVDVIITSDINSININMGTMDGTRPKLLQFVDNHRPSYFGTFRKRSKVVRPRRPLAKDKELVNYDVDSDEEWEEEEQGESISNSEEEDNNGGQDENDEEDDGFFVPHGYLSEDEGGKEDFQRMDVSGDAEQKRELACDKAIETDLARKCQRLKPFVIGCVWTTLDGMLDITRATVTGHSHDVLVQKLKQCEAVPVISSSVQLMKSVGNGAGVERVLPVASSPGVVQYSCQQGSVAKMSFPDEALPDLVRFVHGNKFGMKKLADLFQHYWAAKSSTKTNQSVQNASSFYQNSRISRRQLESIINVIAVKELRTGYPSPCWYVMREVIEKMGLLEDELQVPNHSFVAKIQLLASSFGLPMKPSPVNGLATTNVGQPVNVNASVPVIDLTKV